MKASLLQTGSIPVLGMKVSVGEYDSYTGIILLTSPRSSLHWEKKNCSKSTNNNNSLRRTMSENNIIQWSISRRSSRFSCSSGSRSISFPERIPEEKEEEEENIIVKKKKKKVWPGNNGLMQELEFIGGGIGKVSKIGGGGGGNDDECSKIGEYYKEMLKANPGNPLLLRNYGKYLHEVEGDMKRAEECYERAILASPGDGEVLSLYGKLIWEAHKDEERAGVYFDRAAQASPDDCFVLGSCAHFLWEAAEGEEEEEKEMQQMKTILPYPAMVEAYRVPQASSTDLSVSTNLYNLIILFPSPNLYYYD